MSIYLSFVIRSRSLTDIIPKAQATRASDLLICAYCCTHRRMLPSALGGLRFRVPPVPGRLRTREYGKDQARPHGGFARPQPNKRIMAKSPRRRQGRILEMESCTIKRIKKLREQAPESALPALPRWRGRRGAGCPSRPSAPPPVRRKRSPCARSRRTARR